MIMGDLARDPSKGSIKFFGAQSMEFLDNGKKRMPSFGQSRSQSRSSTHVSHVGSSASSLGQTRYIENWLNQKSLRRIQEKHSIESLGSRQLYTTVLKNEENFVHGIDEFLKETELLNIRRKELLYKEWHENVYEPTRRRIQKTIEAGYPVLDERKRAEYMKYLEYKNRKGDVFLDVMSKDEYDPMCLLHPDSPTNLKVRTPRLLDPLLAQERQRIDEARTISRCETGDILSDNAIRHRWLPPLPLRPLGRHGTTCNTWLEMPLRYIESPVHDRSVKRMKGRSNVSSIEFDDLIPLESDAERKPVLPDIETLQLQEEETAETSENSMKQVAFTLPESQAEEKPVKEHNETTKQETPPDFVTE